MFLAHLALRAAIAPVDTRYIETEINKNYYDSERRGQRIAEVQEFASYMRERFKAAIRAIPNSPLILLDEPDDDTFLLELSISQLVPTNPIVNSVGTTAGFLVPGGSVIKRFGAGSVAMEGRVRDGTKGDILIEFKDREADKEAPFTIRDFQEYAHVRVAIDEWADQYAELAATPYEHEVGDSLPFTIDPS